MNKIWYKTVASLIHKDSGASRDGDAKEICGWDCFLDNTDRNFVTYFGRNLSPTYAAAELLWYLSGAEDIYMISKYAPQYERFANDGIAFGAYGHRWEQDPAFKDANNRGFRSQLDAMVSLLRGKPETRQAIITMWNAGDLLHAFEGDKNDLPCTLSLHFLVRDEKLNLIATMRSNDIWLGLPYDLFAFTTLQRLIAWELGYEAGWYKHQAGSEHLYIRNEEKAKKTLEGEYLKQEYHGYPKLYKGPFDLFDQIKFALDWEESVREENLFDIISVKEQIGNPILQDLVLCCAWKFCQSAEWKKRIIFALNSHIFKEIFRGKA